MPHVPISKGEAIDLLRKWMNENRIVHISLTSAGVLTKVVSQIDEVDEFHALLSLKKSTMPLGQYTFVRLEFGAATEFEYSAAEDAPEPLRTRIAGHDSLLYIYMPGVGVGLAVLPPSPDQS
jgi:hypothetical protein